MRDIHKLLKQNDPIFLRCDLNVPLKDGLILDFERLDRVIPTINLLMEKTSKLVLATHIGRPKSFDPSLSTKILLDAIQNRVDQSVYFCDSAIDYSLKNEGIYLLENLRFYPGEESNNQDFAKQILGPCKLYVNDAFSCSHRKHASVHAICSFAPSYPGLLMQEELHHLNDFIKTPTPPVMAIIGGAKISTKIKLIKNMLQRVDSLVLGGGMANTFLAAQKIEIGDSLYEKEYVSFCQDLLKEKKIVLPIDFKIADSIKDKTYRLAESCPKGMILDIGPKTVDLIKNHLINARMVLMNGPVGAYEYPPFDEGSLEIIKTVAEFTKTKKLISLIGGGDSIAVAKKANVLPNITYASTAGGAFLEYIEGLNLPGVDALKLKK